MPTLTKAQLVLNRTSNLPEDRVVISFWFGQSGSGPWGTTEFVALGSLVAGWLKDAHSTTATPLRSYLGNQIATTGSLVNLYTYDMETGERTTFQNDAPQASVTLGTLTPGTDAAPAEVAICLSYRNLSGSVLGGGNFNAPFAQRRGRIYFGPLGKGSIVAQSAGDARPEAGLRTTLLEATDWLRDQAPSTGHTLCVYSRPFPGRPLTERPGKAPLPPLPARDGMAYPVEEFLIDDAFDTQRRRGARRTNRTILQ